MERKRKVDGDIQACLAGYHRRSACKIVDPQAAATIVVVVVVDSMRRRIDRVGHSCPLQPVACTLGESRIAAELIIMRKAVDHRDGAEVAHLLFREIVGNPTLDVAHTASDFNGVGCDHLSGLAGVACQRDNGMAAGCQVKMSEINPCAASHSLVHLKLLVATGCVNGVDGFLCALRKSGVGNVDGIRPCLGYVGRPRSGRCVFALCRRNLAEGAVAERILEILVCLCLVCKTCAAVAPCLRAVALRIGAGCKAAVVVHNQLDTARVALARTHHISAGILKHRHEIRHYKTLCVKVFYGLEDAGALPLPTIQFRLEIEAVALPYGDNLAVEAFLGVTRLVECVDKRGLLRLADVGIAGVGIQPLDRHSAYCHLYAVRLVKHHRHLALDRRVVAGKFRHIAIRGIHVELQF